MADFDPGYAWWLIAFDVRSRRVLECVPCHRGGDAAVRRAFAAAGDDAVVFYRPTASYFTAERWLADRKEAKRIWKEAKKRGEI